MDITINDLKALLLNNAIGREAIGREAIGRYVIVRSRNEGINAGYVSEMDHTGIVITHARRIWYHKPLDTKLSWYEGVAVSGLNEDSKLSPAVDKKVIMEDYSITYCSDAAIKSITGHKPHGQG